MVRIIQILCLVLVMIASGVLVGELRPFYGGESFLLTATPVMIVEIASALVFAPGWIESVVAATDKGGRIAHVVVFSFVFVAPPTVMILFANQALDHSRGVAQTLPVTGTFSSVSKSGTTYYAVVTTSTPSPRLFALSGARRDIALPRVSWLKLVPGQSKMTLMLHPGRFGLPWYNVVGTTI